MADDIGEALGSYAFRCGGLVERMSIVEYLLEMAPEDGSGDFLDVQAKAIREVARRVATGARVRGKPAAL